MFINIMNLPVRLENGSFKSLNLVGRTIDVCERIGFIFNVKKGDCNRYKATRIGLLKYKELNDNMLVPQKFVVLNNDARWPKETFGMKLGTIVRDIRCGVIYPNQRKDLESIGFDYNLQKK